MNNKIILVILQGLNYGAATLSMGYMNELVKTGEAEFYTVSSENTALSKPIYEEMFYNTSLYINAMLNHQVVKVPEKKNIFELAKERGLKTGAAAFYWASEAYNKERLNEVEFKAEFDEDSNIQYGSFYSDASYPDYSVFSDSEFIRKKYNPNLLLVHSMGIAYAIYKFGLNSQEYYDKILEVHNTLELIIPMWLEAGYGVIVTTEHRLDEKDAGTKEDIAPLWIIGDELQKAKLGSKISKIGITEAICDVLDIKKREKFINCNVTGAEF